MKKIRRILAVYSVLVWWKKNLLWTLASPVLALFIIGIMSTRVASVIPCPFLVYCYPAGFIVALLQALAIRGLPRILADALVRHTDGIGTDWAGGSKSTYAMGWIETDCLSYLNRFVYSFSRPPEDIPKELCSYDPDPIVKYILERRLEE